MKINIQIALNKGLDAGSKDAAFYNRDKENFEKLEENPYCIDLESEEYEAFEKGYENTFQAEIK